MINRDNTIIYTITKITEPDFGCEETEHKEPTALLILSPSENDSTNEGERTCEITEAEIARHGLREGKKIIFTSEGKPLKYVRVVAAVIRDSSGDEEKIFATARGYGEYKGGWEFPGGKIEAGETPQEALVREIREELTAQIRVDDLIETLEYDYPDFHLSMDCFWAEVVSGELVLKEAESAKWLTKRELDSVDWLPADRILVDKMKREW